MSKIQGTTSGAGAGAKGALLVLLAWTIPAVHSTSLIIVREVGSGVSAGWGQTFLGQVPSWWLWAVLTPLVLSLTRRFEIKGPRWWSPLLVHVALGVAVVVLYMTLEAPFAIMREGRTINAATWVNAVLGGLSFQFITQYLIYFALVGVGHALWTSRRLRERDVQASRLEAQLAESRLQSLRAQLQPHFLFNTLHTVGGLVREGDSERAIRMISGLSGLLRHTLDQVRTPEIPLHAELEALERYIEIEEVRFEDRLSVERVVDPEVADTLVPALLLQPLVENSIRHGIQERASAGLVRIEAHREGEALVLVVTDDGAGLPVDFGLPGNQGVGLESTERRLREHYGDQASFNLEGIEPYGTKVTVRLPIRGLR